MQLLNRSFDPVELVHIARLHGEGRLYAQGVSVFPIASAWKEMS